MADLAASDFENPNPCIHDLFTYYNQIYFEGKLGPCTLQWSSKRMTLCAGVCQYSAYGGCEIRLSEPLLKFRPVSDLKNTLLHEMIHAYLFLTNGNKDHDDHGSCFQHMMMMINDFNLVDEERPKDGYAITIYHNFTDEVDVYRTHHWRCVNCSDLIKRAMNRTPSASDCLSRSDACSHPRCHWHKHQRSCGGSYEKIHEPAGYVDKRKKTLAFAECRNVNDQSGDTDDAYLNVNEQKRKMPGFVATKKFNRESAVQAKSAILDNYFCPIRKDEGKVISTQTKVVEKGTVSETLFEGQNLSPSEMNRKRKFLMSSDTFQKENTSDTMAESKDMNLRHQSFSSETEMEEGLSSKLASAQLEACKIESDDVTRKDLGTLSAPSQTTAAALSKASRKNAAGRETLGTCGDFLSRKKYKTVDELHKKQTCKEPLVILAWANWVTYESDEENEEPLINRRAKRRKQGTNSDLLGKGRTVSDTSEDAELVAADDWRNVSEIPIETWETSCKHSSEKTLQKGCNNQVGYHNDSGKQACSKVTATDSKPIFIELSDDENLPVVTGNKSNYSKPQTPNYDCSVPKQSLTHVRDFDKQDFSESSFTNANRRTLSETVEGEMFSSQRDNGREENNATTDVMVCPICNFRFRENEKNIVVNIHIDECLAKCK